VDSQCRFDLLACSRLVEGLGRGDLPSRLLAFLQPYIDADVLQLYCFHRSGSGEIVDIDYFGAAAVSESLLAKIDAGGRDYLLNLPSQRRACPDLCRLRNLENNDAIWVTTPEDFYDPVLRNYYFGGDRYAEFCIYAVAVERHTYVFWLGRLMGADSFSAEEQAALLRLGQLLGPLLAKHAELAPVNLSLGRQANGLRQRLERKLRETQVVLSAREQDVCLGILLGQQAPKIALHLSVAVTSITTYKKRAFAKIGVSTRQELFNWCFLPDASVEA
jgi:DNA-binding CsgD family transcriptional regulator